jgi:hypothetical protein
LKFYCSFLQLQLLYAVNIFLVNFGDIALAFGWLPRGKGEEEMDEEF